MNILRVIVFTCCALLKQCSAAPRRSRSADALSKHERQPDVRHEDQGQESLLFQLLGDYDKVKALSEGSDCRCKCVVRPLSRSACQRIAEGHARAEDFFTVETITSGPHCKCACMAPPSAVNPCEGALRLKQLQEAGKENIKELLEGSLYGSDLLRLHSITNKLLTRIDHLEKAVLVNTSHFETKPPHRPLHTSEMHSATQSPVEWQDEKSRDEGHPSEEKPVEDAPPLSESLSEHSAEVIEMSLAETPLNSPRRVTKTEPHGFIVRGMTFYKSESMVADDGEPGENLFEYDGFSGDGPINLFIEENLLQHKTPRPRTKPSQRIFRSKTEQHFSHSQKKSSESKAKATIEVTTTSPGPSASKPRRDPHEDLSAHSQQPMGVTDKPQETSTAMGPTHHEPPATTDSFQAFLLNRTPPITTATSEQTLRGNAENSPGNPTSPKTTAPPPPSPTTVAPAPNTTQTLPPSLAPSTPARREEALTTASSHVLTSQPSTPPPTQTPPATTVAPTLSTATAEKSVSLEQQREEDKKPHKRKPADCKDTLAMITEPVTQNTYGRSEGAWMKDPKSDSDQIYVTNYFYGNNLLEFANLEIFQQGQFTNSYKLPYNWIGTGHVVYGGAFYYNRAFSRDVIKFDLHHRYVAAWTMLDDAIFEESSSPWEWRSYSDIHMAVDESGLWIIYPALDDEGFLQEVVVLSRLNPLDLSMQRETTWKTGLRRSQYGNCFIVCGVLYFVDSYDRKEANLEYAFDTHTNTQMIPRMPFTNTYLYTTQLGYNPKEGVLYGWDNGHQVTYNMKFAYVEL